MIDAIDRYNREIDFYSTAIKNIKLISVAVIFLMTAVIFTIPASYPAVCMTAITLLLLQIFTSKHFYSLINIHKVKLAPKNKIKSFKFKSPSVLAAGLAVKEGFFLIFLCFDLIWLLAGYITPYPADSFSEYISRLNIGPVSGVEFLWFTLIFWILYSILYLIGATVKEDSHENLVSLTNDIQRIEFSLNVTNYKKDIIKLYGFRIPLQGSQPLILWPGFFQNGFFYDIIPGEISLAEYLWKQNYDIWIFHPRGTTHSGFAKSYNTIDDYAADDIPAIIDFVHRNTGKNPILAGHSQGGISSLISLMGAEKNPSGEVLLSDEASQDRQQKLNGLITLGSYLNFSFSKPSALQQFVKYGIVVNLLGKKIRLITSDFLLMLLQVLNRVPVPFPHILRVSLLKSLTLRILIFPVTLLLNFVAKLDLWQFLYNIKNVSIKSRIHLFYKTIDATFSGILSQFHNTIKNEKMYSADGKVIYSDNYNKINLPVSIVTMEHDTLADPVEAKKNMFLHLGSEKKYFTEWSDQGHEDFVMNPVFFPRVLDAIKILEN